MEEATGAPSSLADWNPKRLRASGRDGGLSHDDATPVGSHNAPFPSYKAARSNVRQRPAGSGMKSGLILASHPCSGLNLSRQERGCQAPGNISSGPSHWQDMLKKRAGD